MIKPVDEQARLEVRRTLNRARTAAKAAWYYVRKGSLDTENPELWYFARGGASQGSRHRSTEGYRTSGHAWIAAAALASKGGI